MPFYDLKCKRCGFKFNVMATIEEKEKGLIPCLGCGSHELERIYENINISVKSKNAEAEEHTKNCMHCKNSDLCPNASK